MTNDTLINLLPEFIQHLKNLKRSPSTILAYRADIEQLLKFLQEKQIVTHSQIKQVNIEAFRDSLLNLKYMPKTVSRKLNATKTFFRWLAAEKKFTFNPAEKVSHPKIELTIPDFLSPLEYRALRDVVRGNNRITATIELILQTGLRISEVASLKLKNVTNTQIVVEAYATQPKRIIPLNKPAKEALNMYLKERPQLDSPYVFTSRHGKPLAVRNIRAAIDRCLQKAGISQYSVNDLRTTFIVENLKDGVDVVIVSQAAGHKRIAALKTSS
jgi:site-specific recombinase XerD